MTRPAHTPTPGTGGRPLFFLFFPLFCLPPRSLCLRVIPTRTSHSRSSTISQVRRASRVHQEGRPNRPHPGCALHQRQQDNRGDGLDRHGGDEPADRTCGVRVDDARRLLPGFGQAGDLHADHIHEAFGRELGGPVSENRRQRMRDVGLGTISDSLGFYQPFISRRYTARRTRRVASTS